MVEDKRRRVALMDKSSRGNASQFFIAGQLCRRGYSAVASEPLESASKAPAAEVAASCCLRRATALAGLGLELWG